MSAFGLSEAYAGIELFEYARKQGWLERITDIFKPQHKILVLGSTGGWNQREAVYEHYTGGQYQALLGELVTLAPSVLEYCSVLHKFYGLGPLAGTFDEADRNRTRLKLVTALLEAVGKSDLNG